MKSKALPSKAVFLDRDGTLIEDRGHLGRFSEVVFYEQTVPALKRLIDAGFRLFIITHQSGIAKGLITADQAAAVNQYVVDELQRYGIDICTVYCCPHNREDGCECIKPKPFFLRQAVTDFTVDLSRSFVVGDHPHDVELADNTGATGIYVLTGHGVKHRGELKVDSGHAIVADIGAATDWILRKDQNMN